MKRLLALFFLVVIFSPLGVVHAASYSAGCYCKIDVSSSYTPTSAETAYTNWFNIAVDSTATADDCSTICHANMGSVTGSTGSESQFFADAASAQKFFADAAATAAAPDAQVPVSLQTPNLSVQIPGLTFSKVLQQNGYLYVNTIGEYIGAVYRYALGAASIIAIVMIMVGGVQYVMGGADPEMVGAAKTRITNAVTGLILILSAYVILVTVNPALVTFSALKVQSVPYQALNLLNTSISSNLTQCNDVKGIVKKCSATKLSNPPGWSQTLTDAVNQAASDTGVDPILIAAHLQTETRGNVNYGGAIGPCGEIGPSQFMATTYTAIVGGDCCNNVAHKSKTITSDDASVCKATTTDWPPSTTDFPHCNTSICGTCEVASDSCIATFITPAHLKDVIEATAKLIAYNLGNKSVGGDEALEMCAYNGSGKAAAAYAQTAAGYYATLCTGSGGSQ